MSDSAMATKTAYTCHDVMCCQRASQKTPPHSRRRISSHHKASIVLRTLNRWAAAIPPKRLLLIGLSEQEEQLTVPVAAQPLSAYLAFQRLCGPKGLLYVELSINTLIARRP